MSHAMRLSMSHAHECLNYKDTLYECKVALLIYPLKLFH